jgi:hypothetical protein
MQVDSVNLERALRKQGFFFSKEKKQKTFMSSPVRGYGIWPARSRIVERHEKQKSLVPAGRAPPFLQKGTVLNCLLQGKLGSHPRAR